MSKTFSGGLDEFDIEMKDVAMVWYIIAVLITIAVLIPCLIVCCKYSCRLRAMDIARRNKLTPDP